MSGTVNIRLFYKPKIFFSTLRSLTFPYSDVKTKVLKNDEIKHQTGEQVDFRSKTLKNSVKTKTVEQDELRRMGPDQKDFRQNLKSASEEKETPVLDHSDYHTPSQSPEKEQTPPSDRKSKPEVISLPPENLECVNGDSFEITSKV